MRYKRYQKKTRCNTIRVEQRMSIAILREITIPVVGGDGILVYPSLFQYT